jgi:hypothetical protein
MDWAEQEEMIVADRQILPPDSTMDETRTSVDVLLHSYYLADQPVFAFSYESTVHLS